MKVRDVMTKRVIRISPEESIGVAARMLSRYNLGALPVCDGAGKIQGMVTDRDIVLRCVAAEHDPERTPVRQVMTGHVVTVGADMRLEEAAERMSREQVRRLPVEENGKLCGMVSLGDLACTEKFSMEAAEAFSEICSNVARR